MTTRTSAVSPWEMVAVVKQEISRMESGIVDSDPRAAWVGRVRIRIEALRRVVEQMEDLLR